VIQGTGAGFTPCAFAFSTTETEPEASSNRRRSAHMSLSSSISTTRTRRSVTEPTLIELSLCGGVRKSEMRENANELP
jgi:hypothetical protein